MSSVVNLAVDQRSPNETTTRATTAEILVDTLMNEGMDTIFALPGIQNDQLFDAFYHAEGRGLRTINPRHEQAAAYMAAGYGMATGKPGVYAVVPGPGFLNTTAALSTAWGCCAPVLAIAGQIPQAMIGRGVGMLHEIPDQLGVMRQFTKWSARIAGPTQAAGLVAQAYQDAAAAPSRPVGLECAMDVWGKQGKYAARLREPRPAEPIDSDLAARAAQMLAKAQRPMIVVGAGAQNAASEVRSLAKRLGAPVSAHRMGRGIISSRDPQCVDPVAAHLLWADADVVLAVGTRLQQPLMNWGIDDDLKIIRVDADPNAFDKLAMPAIGLAGDAAPVLRAIIDALPPGRPGPTLSGWIEAARTRAWQKLETLTPQRAWLQAMRDVLPENGVFVDELTQLGYASRALFPVYEPRSFLSPGYQGTLGWGYPAALGAQVALSDRKVLSVVGDGGFLFNAGELATAAQHNIPLVTVVVNDNAYGNVARIQDAEFGGRRIASSLNAPNFVKLAESFGVAALSVDTPEGLRCALETAFAANVPFLIEAKACPMPDPWTMLRYKPSRGRAAR